MKRMNRAGLVFLSLVQTISALAGITDWVATTTSSSNWRTAISQTIRVPSSTQEAEPKVQQLTLRLARYEDIPSIQRCNLATLPENYNSEFYMQYLRQWPQLCLVVVDEDATDEDVTFTDKWGPFSAFPRSASTSTKVVAYILGKVQEEDYEEVNDDKSIFSRWAQKPDCFGHITSLAVLKDHRRRGLANRLLKQFHHQLQHHGEIAHVGLHVRRSNQVATRLYESFGYREAERLSAYYEDGEDGLYMIKALRRQPAKTDRTYQLEDAARLFRSLRQSTRKHMEVLRSFGRPTRPPTSSTHDDDYSVVVESELTSAIL